MTAVIQNPLPRPEAPGAHVARLRTSFDDRRTRPLGYRDQQLAGLARLLKEREQDLVAALHHDLGKPALEAFSAEMWFLIPRKYRLHAWKMAPAKKRQKLEQSHD